MLTRYPDWPERLRAFLDGAARRPFSWAEFNCCLFAAAGVAALTGTDPAAPLRGKFTTRRQAYAALKRFASGGVPEIAGKIAAALGCPEIPPRLAQRGDVVLVDGTAGPALGLCAGAAVAVLKPEGGIGYVPIVDPSLRKAWKI